MIRHIWALLLFACATTNLGADTKTESLFDHRFWDVGTVPRSMTYYHTFQVTNNTDKPLHILSIRVSCGCVSARAEKKELSPGESTSVIAQMESRQFSGVITKTIFILVDQPSYEEVRIHVQANVVPDLSITPASLNFGKIKKGSTPEKTVNVSFGGNQMSPIQNATSESGYVQVKVESPTENAFQHSYQVKATLSRDLPVGTWYCTLALVSANRTQAPINIPMTVEVVP